MTATKAKTFLQKSVGHLSNAELLKTYSALTDELRARKLVKSSNSVTSDYGEYVAERRIRGLQLVGKNTKGYDAVDRRGLRYQIKSRRPTRFNRSMQLGVIRNLDSQPFDFLIAVLFEEDFSLRNIWKMPLSVVKKYSRFSKHQNGHILVLEKKVIGDKRVLKVV